MTNENPEQPVGEPEGTLPGETQQPAQPAAPPAPAAPEIPPAAQQPTPPQPGYVPSAPYAPSAPMQPRLNTMALISLILGIVGLFVFGIPAVVAVVLGHIALSQIKKRGERGRGLAIAGLVTGYVSIVLWAILLVLGLILGIGFLAATQNGNIEFDQGHDTDSSEIITDENGNDVTDEVYREVEIFAETSIVTTLTGSDQIFWVPGGATGGAVCKEASGLALDVDMTGNEIVSGTVAESFGENGSAGLALDWDDIAVADCGYTIDQVESATDFGSDAADDFFERLVG
ncbi:DUF4190 domain-containing protein [Leucobacter sp. cx-42]|uniref:DUF4190 domain-containing protein n=1 Tax=unclassified Leucobacter TaxID=2621730 RepID=UPI00165E81CE|nr:MULTISPECIES: DUF4190 domain-containing protein [unclassified Leucobacter]MBC9954265.1 DUF4190 domain-containing protein [Leucobacter sp. cx-42]